MISLVSPLRPLRFFGSLLDASLYRLLNILHWLLDFLLWQLLDILLVRFMSRVLARAWTFSAIFRLNWLLLPAKYGLCFFLLKTPFSSSHRRRSRCRRLTNFLVNSALMVAMLVKLLLVLIASNTSPATSLEVSLSWSKYARLCCKHFSFNFLTFLSFRFSRVVASLFEASWGFSWSTFTYSWASWKYFSSSLAKGLEYDLLYKGLFACCRWMITNLLRISRCHL